MNMDKNWQLPDMPPMKIEPPKNIPAFNIKDSIFGEMLELLKSIDKNVKEINAKLK